MRISLKNLWVVRRVSHGLSMMEYAVVSAVLLGVVIAFVTVTTGILREGVGAVSSDLSTSDSLSRQIGTVEVQAPVRALELLPAQLPHAIRDMAYTFDFLSVLSAPAGTDPATLSWSLSSGTLPLGMVLSSDGVLSGTHTDIGPAQRLSLDIQVSDGTQTANRVYELIVRDSGLALLPMALPQGLSEIAYEFDFRTLAEFPAGLTAADATWSVVSGALPDGMILSTTSGIVSGVYAELEDTTAAFTLQVSASSFTALQSYEITVTGEGILLAPDGPFAWSAATPTSVDFGPYVTTSASVDPGTITWSVEVIENGVVTALPEGMALVGDTVTGAPMGVNDRSFALRVTAQSGVYNATQDYPVTYVGQGLVLSDVALPTVRANLFFDFGMSLRLTLGVGIDPATISWSVVSGALPSNITLNPTTGVLRGTHTGLEDFTTTATIEARLPDDRFAQQSYEFTVIGAGAVATPTDLPTAFYGVPYSYDLRNTLTTRNPFDLDSLSWTLSGSSLPSGMEFSGPTGLLSGTHHSLNDTELTFLAVATDALNVTASAVHSLTIDGLAPWSAQSGLDNTCALDERGAAWCWGRLTSDGNLGNPTLVSDALTPVRIDDTQTGRDFIDIATGAYLTCAVEDTGSLWCWGNGALGEMGDDLFATENDTPVAVNQSVMGTTAVAVSVGESHACALDVGGDVWCWGSNAQGRLGDGSNTTSGVPVAVERPTGMTAAFVDISLGAAHSCALDEDGAVWCWGQGSSGQIGGGNTNTLNATPVQVEDGVMGPVARISAGGAHTCAVSVAGTAWCWGSAADGRLGASVGGNQDTPVAVVAPGLSGVVDIAAYADHTCAVRGTDGTVWCWGQGSFGRLGNASTASATTPVMVDTAVMGTGVIRLSQGSRAAHSCAWKAERAMWCWGEGANGRLGNNATTQTVSSPVLVQWPAIGVD